MPSTSRASRHTRRHGLERHWDRAGVFLQRAADERPQARIGRREALRRGESEVTTVVNEILKGRHWPKYKRRRVEHLLRRIGPHELELEEAAGTQ